MKWLIITTILLAGCSSTTTPTKSSNINYTPMDKELIKDVKPYSSKPEPTLKEINKQKEYDECMKRVDELHKNNHNNSPSIFQKIIDDNGCS